MDDGALGRVTPTRIVDTRSGTGGLSGPVWLDGGLITFDATAVVGLPTDRVAAVVLNVTVTNTQGNAYLKAFASGAWRPATSNSNWQPGLTRAAMVVAPVNSDGYATLFAAGDPAGQTDVVVDVMGYVMGLATRTEARTTRLCSAPSPTLTTDIRNSRVHLTMVQHGRTARQPRTHCRGTRSTS